MLGQPVRGFASAFLAEHMPEQPDCLVLGMRMDGVTGLELQRKLADDGATIPVVMISGYADVRVAVEAMTLGAVTLLEKPFRLDELLGHLRRALARDRDERAARAQHAETGARLAALTAKEREVLELVAGEDEPRDGGETRAHRPGRRGPPGPTDEEGQRPLRPRVDSTPDFALSDRFLRPGSSCRVPLRSSRSRPARILFPCRNDAGVSPRFWRPPNADLSGMS